MNKSEHRSILITLGALTAIGPFSIDMYLPGFASISSDLHTSISNVGLSLTSYFIGISGGQLIYGPLLDRFGRKKPLIFGLLLYILSAVFCGISPSIYFLIVSRLFLALGACVCLVASRAIVRDLFPSNEIAKIYSLLMLIMGVAPIIAPSVGGFVTTHLGWRFIFFVLGCIAGLMLWAVISILPESRKADSTVVLRLKPIFSGYATVFLSPSFLIFTLSGGIAYAGMFAYISGSPFVFMKLFGVSESQFGIIFSINALGLIGGSQINRLMLKKWNSYKISHTLSYVLVALGFGLVVGASLNLLTVITTLILIFFFLFCLGFITPNVTALALQPFTQNAGSASALLGSLQMILGAISSALVSSFSDGTSKPMAFVMLGCALLCLMLILVYEYAIKKRVLV